jgi:hypothetical protein
MPMGGPLQAIIAEAIEAVYAQAQGETVPQMSDLAQAARSIMATKKLSQNVPSSVPQ